jgi:hypothetical protein
MRRTLAFLVLATAFAAPAATAGAGASGAFFVSSCRFAHRAPDDPIVYPRAPGFSHDHSFVGNVSTNAFSTLSSLRRAGTTCTPRGDTAAYWAPTLYADGRPVAPSAATIYYRRLTAAPVRPFPAGLRMVAGDSHGVRAECVAVTVRDCSLVKTTFYGPNGAGVSPLDARSSEVPACPGRAQLQLHVRFPECWDGRRLDSSDHRSHMAYAVGGRCPAAHPVAVPGLEIVYRYPSNAVAGAHVVILSSGGQHSGHADFVNAWRQDDLTRLVHRCLDGYAYCSAEVNLG